MRVVLLPEVYATPVEAELYLEVLPLAPDTIIVPLEGRPCADGNVMTAVLSAVPGLQVTDVTAAPLVMLEMATAGEGVFVNVMPWAVLFATVSVPVIPPAPELLSDTGRVSESAVTFFVTSAVNGVTERVSRASAVASMSVLAVLKGVAESRLGLVE